MIVMFCSVLFCFVLAENSCGYWTIL